MVCRYEDVIDLVAVSRIRIVANAVCVKALGAEFAEITFAFVEGRNGGLASFAGALAEAFVVQEEEGFVALERAAEGSAVLIAFERLDGLGEKALGVERLVAEKFPE